MTGKDKKMNFPIIRTIRLNEQQDDKWNPKRIRAFLEGETVDLDLMDKLVLLMVKAGVNSKVYGIDIEEAEIQSNINRLTESGKIG